MKVVPILSKQVERIESICLYPSSLVNCVAFIAVEDRPFSILLPECFLEALSNSIEVGTIDLGSNLQVVIAKDEVLVFCREEDGSVPLPGYRELERVGGVVDADCGGGGREGEISQRIGRENPRLRHLEASFSGIDNFEGEVAESQSPEDEDEFFADGAGGFEVVLVAAGVLQLEGDCGGVDDFVGDSVLGLSQGEQR